MTDEVGAIIGELELQTRVTPDGDIEAMVRYSGAKDLYTVSGSPVRTATLSEYPDQGELRAAHGGEKIIEHLRRRRVVWSRSGEPSWPSIAFVGFGVFFSYPSELLW
jgi:hypothetical protein